MELPVTLVLRPSLTLGVALVLAHGLAGAGVAPTSLPLWVKLTCGLGLAVSLAFSLSRHVLRPPVRAFTLKADGRVELERRDGARAEASVHPQTTVFSWLVVLVLRAGSGTLALAFPVDALGAEDHRRLRIWLRWKATLSVAA